MKSSEFHRYLQKNGWVHIRTSGSHYINEKDGRTYPIPYHGSKEMGEAFVKKSWGIWGLNKATEPYKVTERSNNNMKTLKIVIERSAHYNCFQIAPVERNNGFY